MGRKPMGNKARRINQNLTELNIMKLSELIAKVGEGNIKAQWIDESFTDIKTNKKGETKITFRTTEATANEYAFDLSKMKKRGLVIWFPVDKM